MFTEVEVALWLAAVGAVFGLIFGSAINAFVWRWHEGRSWTKGRSVCSNCGHVLAAKDLVPVLSWVSLGGKCRYCHKPIQDPPAVELVTAAVFALSAVALAPDSPADWLRLGFWILLALILITLAVYDARWMLLPFKLTKPLIAVASVYSVAMAAVTGNPQVLWGSLEAAAVAGGGFFLLYKATKEKGIGGGDVPLAFAMGLILGVQATAVAMFVAFNAGAAVGLVMIAARKRGRWSKIPFGPYLVGGTIVAFLYGRQIADWYLGLNGL